MSPQYTCVAWDADGVVLDSRTLAWEAGRHIVRLFYKVPPVKSPSDYRKIFGREAQAELVGEADAATLRALHRILMRHRAHRIPLFREVLNVVRRLLVPSYIMTSAYAQGVCQVLGEYTSNFVAILGREAGRKRDLLAGFLKGGAAVYVTDSVRDIQMCHELGVHVVAIGWGYDSLGDLASASPDYIAPGEAELLALFRSLGLIRPLTDRMNSGEVHA